MHQTSVDILLHTYDVGFHEGLHEGLCKHCFTVKRCTTNPESAKCSCSQICLSDQHTPECFPVFPHLDLHRSPELPFLNYISHCRDCKLTTLCYTLVAFSCIVGNEYFSFSETYISFHSGLLPEHQYRTSIQIRGLYKPQF